MPKTVEILTPEAVPLTYPLAGVGSRFVAVLADMTILSLITALLIVLAGLLGIFTPLRTASPWIIAIAILLLFSLWQGYFIYYETVWRGQTPGKRSVGIRVIQDGGLPVTFRCACIRNLLRAVDFLPVWYGVGGLCVLFHPLSKRLGDMAAGTLVVRERMDEPVRGKRNKKTKGEPQPEGEPAPALGLDWALLPLSHLDKEDLRTVRRFLERREQLDIQTEQQIATRLAIPLLQSLELTPQDIDHRFEQFLSELIAYHDTTQL